MYEESFQKKGNAHDALEDCMAFKAVINNYGQPLMKQIHETATPMSFLVDKRQCQTVIATNKRSCIGKVASKTVIEKLNKLGISYEKCGKEAVVAFLAYKSRG